MEQPLWIGLIDIFKGISDGRHISWGILNSIFFGSILILLFYLLKNIRPLKHFFGTANLLIPCAACLLLLLIPVETKFQKSIILTKVMNPIMKFLLDKGIELYGKTLNTWQLFLTIWIVGIIISLLVFITKQIKVQNLIKRLPKTQIPIPEDIIGSVHLKVPTQYIHLYLCDGITIPFSTGITRKKSILLPGRNYTDTERNFIIRHELTHITHHHHLIALAMEIVRIIYWWNPCVYLLRSEVLCDLETTCDRCVLKNATSAAKADYMNTLLRVFSERNTDTLTLTSGLGILGTESRRKNLRRRFDILTNESSYSRGGRIGSIILITLALTVTLFCMTVFFCPFLLPTEINLSSDDAEGEIIAVMPTEHIMRTGDKYILSTQDSEKELTPDEAASLIENGVPFFDLDDIAS